MVKYKWHESWKYGCLELDGKDVGGYVVRIQGIIAMHQQGEKMQTRTFKAAGATSEAKRWVQRKCEAYERGE